MKNFLNLFLFALLPVSLAAQSTLVLQPDSANGKDGYMDDINASTGQASSPEFNAAAWTISGTPVSERALIDFNLSALPANATVLSAQLTLYNNPNSSNGFQNGEHSHISGSNASLLQRITSPWPENVSWNAQPSTTTQNEVPLMQDITPHEDYIVNVTQLIIDQLNNPGSSFGFMLKLQTESYYRILVFASSDHPNAALWPKLEITYTTPCTSTLVLQPDSADGKDGYIDDINASIGQASSPELNSAAWTIMGAPVLERGLIDFNLSALPPGSTVQSASLTLYNNPNSTNGFQNGEHSHTSGSNAALLQRIVSPWAENVSWNNQPSTTTQNEVLLPQDTTPHEDYEIDVTQLINDQINNPGSSFGFMLKLQTELFYRILVFASSDHPNPALWPRLEICYTAPSGLAEFSSNSFDFTAYPNPAQDKLFVSSNNIAEEYSLYDVQGREIIKSFAGSTKFAINLKGISYGVYFLRLKSGGSLLTKKIVINQ